MWTIGTVVATKNGQAKVTEITNDAATLQFEDGSTTIFPYIPQEKTTARQRQAKLYHDASTHAPAPKAPKLKKVKGVKFEPTAEELLAEQESILKAAQEKLSKITTLKG